MRKKTYRRKTNITGLILPALVIGALLYISKGKGKFGPLDILNIVYIVLGIILALVLLQIVIQRFKIYKKRKMYRESGMNRIDHMTGPQFEDYLRIYFSDLGFKVQPHKGGKGDRGADLIMKDPEGKKVVVQAKRYKSKVPYAAIEQIHTARTIYKADRAILISTYYLTKQSETTAKELGIEVWNRDKLIQHMYMNRKAN